MRHDDFGRSKAAVKKAVKEWKEATGEDWCLENMTRHQKDRLRVACAKANLNNPVSEPFFAAFVGWVGAMVAVLIAWAVGLMPMIGASLTEGEVNLFLWEFYGLLLLITAVVFSVGAIGLRLAQRSREAAAALKVLEAFAAEECATRPEAGISRDPGNRFRRIHRFVLCIRTLCASSQQPPAGDAHVASCGSANPSSSEVN